MRADGLCVSLALSNVRVTGLHIHIDCQIKMMWVDHRDGMVRAAVRTLTLNVYSIRDPAVQAFVISKPASNYFNELAIFVAEQCQVTS